MENKYSKDDLIRVAIYCWNIASNPKHGKTYNVNEIVEDYTERNNLGENKYFEFFKAGQESMEEGGKGFEQYYNETFGGNK